MNKGKIFRVILGLLLLFVVIGTVYENKGFFNNIGNIQTENMTDSIADLSDEEKQIQYYCKHQKLDKEAFCKSQVGKIGDKIYYNYRIDDYSWIKVTGMNVYYEVPQWLTDSADIYKNSSFMRNISFYNIDFNNIKSEGYCLVEVTFSIPADIKYNEYRVSTEFCVYSETSDYNRYPNVSHEGLLINDDNLLYIEAGSTMPSKDNKYYNAFRFKNSEGEGTFREIYLISEEAFNNSNLYIYKGSGTNGLPESEPYYNADYLIYLKSKD